MLVLGRVVDGYIFVLLFYEFKDSCHFSNKDYIKGQTKICLGPELG